MKHSTSCRKRIRNTVIKVFAFALSLGLPGLIASSHARSYRSKGDQKKVDKARLAPQESNATRGDKSAIRPFRVHVPEKEITDLRRRIRETRWPDRETVADQFSP